MIRVWAKARNGRGYTAVELLMAIAVFMVSLLGIMSMQKVAAASNWHSKNLATAQHIAQSTATQLELEATLWTTGTPSGWLNPTQQWTRLNFVAARNFGSAFDGLGNPLSDDNVAAARFCANVRISPLFSQNLGRVGNSVYRAEIRVYWLREGLAPISGSAFCNEGNAVLANLGQRPDVYQMVYQTTAVRQHAPL